MAALFDTPSPRRVEDIIRTDKRRLMVLNSTNRRLAEVTGQSHPNRTGLGAGLWATDAGAAPGVWKPARDWTRQA